MTLAIPPGPFGCILADPPWRFRTWSETNQAKAASRHYSLMEMDEMAALPVAASAAENCVLLMWAINPMLPHALALIEAWGFKFKTVAFTWAKRTPRDTSWHMGLGYWTRQNTEQCLLAVRGKPKRLPGATSVPQLLVEPRREHSRKPDEHYDRIERLVAGPYLEMFARAPREGWTVWGNQTDKFAPCDSGSGLCPRPGTGLSPEGRRAAAPKATHRPQTIEFPQLSMFMEAAE